MKRLGLLLLIAALLVSLIPAQAQDDGTSQEMVAGTIPCPDEITGGLGFNMPPELSDQFGFVLPEEIEGETYSCGIVTVPQNYDAPDGKNIDLFYVKLHSFSQSPAPDPVIYLAGGPGSSGSGELSGNPFLLNNMNSIRERRDIYAYDQRGTGFSEYITCAPHFSTYGLILDRSDDPTVPDLINSLMSTELGTATAAYVICGLVYNEATAVDFSQYNSVASSQDIRHLAEALGYSEYNLYGTSYGTRLAQYALRETPESIRSAVIDGVVSPAISNAAETNYNRDQAYLAIFAQCAADAACNAAYPNLTERFAALLAELEANPLVFDPPLVLNPNILIKSDLDPIMQTFDPSFFVGLAGHNNGLLDGGHAHLVPRIILAAEEGDIDWIRANLGTDAAGETSGPTAPPDLGVPENFQFDQPFYQQPLTALLAAAQAESENRDQGLHVLWNSVAFDDFASRVRAGENQDDIIEDLIVWSTLPYQVEFNSDTLVAFANERLSGEAAVGADLVALAMNEDDLRLTKWHIIDLAMVMGTPENRHSSTGMQYAVNCEEDAQFSSIEDSLAYRDNSPFPQLQVLAPEDYETYVWGPCLTFGASTSLDASVTNPVTSDIPTLVFQEQLDTQTPLPWGRFTAENLGHAYLVEWNNMGHIAVAHDIHQCAGDIAAAFLDDPTREPDSTCSLSDRYKLHWVLPE